MKFENYQNPYDTQLALIRVYIGLNFIHHFAEKFGLFGWGAFNDVQHYFLSIGLDTNIMLVAGLCEFAAFVGFTFGLFTRLAAIGTAVYLIICAFLGGHIYIGFIWANHGETLINGHQQMVYGGWEYPIFWAFICGSFAITGGRKWSVDTYIRHYSSIKILRFFAR